MKKVCVVGFGESGQAAALLAQKQGAQTLLSDVRARTAFDARRLASLEAAGIELHFGDQSVLNLAQFDLVVVSPGVPNAPWLTGAARRGVRIVGELEFASWHVEAPIIAIGGTNGKSTTTELCGALLATTGKPCFVGGNLGTPLSRAVLDDHTGLKIGGYCVVEVSSFQLERVAGFCPSASILLNITPDHLDRYPSFEAYAYAKGGAFANQTASDVAVVVAGDSLSARIASLGGGRLECVDGDRTDSTVFCEANAIIDQITNVSISTSRLKLAGRHNITNICAAWAACRSLDADASRFGDALSSFEGLPHRMVRVATCDGITFYDDSKGTNVGASVTAVLGVSEPRVVLIAGGRDKGGSYAPLMNALAKKGRGLVVLGEAKEAIAAAAKERLGLHLPCVSAHTMADAVSASMSLAAPGDAVLLSPACSSFDMFSGYKERGDVFCAAVRALCESRGTRC